RPHGRTETPISERTCVQVEEIRTLVVVRELSNGDVLVFPAADTKLAAYGGEDEALLEARMFLSDYFARADAETVARFLLPEGTTLHETDVLLAREDLPRRVAIDAPIRVPCVVIPDLPTPKGERDRWVLVLPLSHVFHVPAPDDLDEAITAEVKR